MRITLKPSPTFVTSTIFPLLCYYYYYYYYYYSSRMSHGKYDVELLIVKKTLGFHCDASNDANLTRF